MYQLILFDLDGTVINSIPLILETYHHTYRSLGLTLPDDETIKTGIGLTLKSVVRDNIPPELQTTFLERFRAYNEARLETHIGLFIPVWHLLTGIRALGIPMGIMTSKRREATLRSLDQFRLTPFFRWIRTADDSQAHKPSPEPILQAVQQAEQDLCRSIPIKQVLYIGDNTMDIQSANRAGCDCGVVRWSQIEPERLSKAGSWFWIDSVADIRRVPDETD